MPPIASSIKPQTFNFDEEFADLDDALREYDFDKEFSEFDELLCAIDANVLESSGSLEQKDNDQLADIAEEDKSEDVLMQDSGKNEFIRVQNQAKLLSNQILEKDGALSLLRSRLSNAERELLELRAKLNSKSSRESKADQAIIEKMQRELEGLRAERDAQDEEIMEMNLAKKRLQKALDEERKKKSSNKRNLQAVVKEKQNASQSQGHVSRSNDVLKDEFDELEEQFNIVSSNSLDRSQAKVAEVVTPSYGNESSNSQNKIDFDNSFTIDFEASQQMKNVSNSYSNKPNIFFKVLLLENSLDTFNLIHFIESLEDLQHCVSFSHDVSLLNFVRNSWNMFSSSSQINNVPNVSLLIPALLLMLKHSKKEFILSSLSLLELLFSLDEQSRNLFVDQVYESRPLKEIYAGPSDSKLFMKSRFTFADKSRIHFKSTRKMDSNHQFVSLFEHLALLFGNDDLAIVEKAIHVFQALYENEGAAKLQKIGQYFDFAVLSEGSVKIEAKKELHFKWNYMCTCLLNFPEFIKFLSTDEASRILYRSIIHPLLEMKWNFENLIDVKIRVSCIKFLIVWATLKPSSFSETLPKINVDSEHIQESSTFTYQLLMYLSFSIYHIIISLKYEELSKEKTEVLIDSIMKIFPIFELLILHFQYEKIQFRQRHLLVHILTAFSKKSAISPRFQLLRNRANCLRARIIQTYFSDETEILYETEM